MSGEGFIDPGDDKTGRWQPEDESHGPYEAHVPGELLSKTAEPEPWEPDQEIAVQDSQSGEEL